MSIKLNIEVNFRSADEGQDDIVYSVVRDKVLELRSALVMLSMSQQIQMSPPTVSMTKRGDTVGMIVDLDREKHSEET